LWFNPYHRQRITPGDKGVAMADPLEQIREYYRVEEDIYTAGQPTEDQIILLGHERFEVVINLATSHSPNALQDEQQLVMANGMAYVHIPVEWENPTLEDLHKFFHFFSTYGSFKTFVHCAKNMRVSAFVFLYQTLVENKDPATCLLDMLTIWKPNETWQAFIDHGLEQTANISDWKIDWVTNRIVTR
jgi:protein tyrosine phosphatase (PTP) superfamily phosphohydrolase (DUF442 family)